MMPIGDKTKQAEQLFVSLVALHWFAGLMAFILSIGWPRFAIFGCACWGLAGLTFIGMCIDMKRDYAG